MLIVRGIGSTVAAYYLGQDHPGRWSPGAGRHLGLDGRVTGPDLTRVLEGRHPESGRFLPARRPARRRAGYDLIWAAPKSVSLLAGATSGDVVRRAHEAAVTAVMEHIEAEMGLGRSSLLTASFGHTRSAAGQPHLHTHVLVANLLREGSGWRCLPNDRPWKVDRTALTGLYQLDLRHQLEVAGFRLDWRMDEHGLADIAAVGRSSVRQASAQTRLVGQFGRVEARLRAVPAPWSEVALDRPTRASGAPPAAEHEVARRVTVRLGAARSDFRRADVFDALAGCRAAGLAVPEAKEWVDRFCATQIQVRSPTSKPRWTTRQAQRLDAQLRDVLLRRGGVEFRSVACGETGLLAHTESLSGRLRSWAATGTRVVVDSRDELSGARWRALTGLDRRTRGSPADVVIVDGADRRTSAHLMGLARSTDAHLVLVEGGTQARLTNPTSHGARDAADALGRHVPEAPAPWRIPSGPELDPARSWGRDAAERLLHEWDAAGRRGLLVGLGPEETAALNRAVRGDRDHWCAGDPVVALRHGPGVPAHGTLGTVTGTAPLEVEWAEGRRSVLDRSDEGRIAPAWAVTPAVAHRLRRDDVQVLGPPSGLDLIDGRHPTVPRREPPALTL